MAQKAGAYTLPADAKPLLDLYQELYLLTEGKCTPLIGKALVEAGYDSSYTLKSRVMQPVPAWNEMMEYNFPSLILKCPVLLDFGAAGKGYLVDIIAELLLSRGIFSFCIDASGDIRCQGLDTALRIGLEHPENESQVIGVMRLVNGSLCGSAGNRRAWKGWNHIIDPDKLVSPTEIIATWVTARTAMEADGLATCLFFMPASSLHTAKQFESLVLYADYSYDMTKGFPAELFLT
jgi:thiamine biosynthesis lipoprotein